MFRKKQEEIEEAKMAMCSICNEKKRIVNINLTQFDDEEYADNIIVVATLDCYHINIYKLDWVHKKSFSNNDIIKIKEKYLKKKEKPCLEK